MATTLDSHGPFDGASYTEDFWRDFFRHLTGSGVIDGVGSEFAVIERPAGANMSVDVGTGECFIRGHWGESTAAKNLAISAADATNARIDRVILRANFTDNRVELDVLTGTPAGSPSAPSLTQNSAMWEVSLAQISVPATDTTIGTAQITDQRTILGFPISTEGFRAYRSTNQALNASTWTTIVFDTEVRDEGADYNNATGEWTVPATGWYDVGGSVAYASLSDGDSYSAALYVNGSAHSRIGGFHRTGAAGTVIVSGTIPLYLTAADVVTLRGFRSSAGNASGGSPDEIFFTAKRRF